VNVLKLTNPDGRLGQLLIMLRALTQLARLLAVHPSRQTLDFTRLVLKVQPRYTMLSPTRLLNLYRRVKEADHLGLDGDVVECGAWNGGALAVMAKACTNPSRRFWAFDSFEGLPMPTNRDGKREQRNYFEGYCTGREDNVRRVMGLLDVPLDKIQIMPGWFEETLPRAEVGPIAVLHVDADWYEGVKLVLETFYGSVVPGGFIVLDDYWRWPGCKAALEDFMIERNIALPRLLPIDRGSAGFRKPV